jgi:hypothetical protein
MSKPRILPPEKVDRIAAWRKDLDKLGTKREALERAGAAWDAKRAQIPTNRQIAEELGISLSALWAYVGKHHANP